MKRSLCALGILAAGLSVSPVHAAGLDVSDSGWNVKYDKKAKTVSLYHAGEPVMAGASLTAVTLEGDTLRSSRYPKVTLRTSDVDDAFGNGKRYTYSYSGLKGKPDVEQSFYVYPALPYVLVEGSVISGKEDIAVIELSPIVSSTPTTLALGKSENRIYDMPFDNDNWATFTTHTWSGGKPVTSCEATVFFNVADRKGVVIGSVDHSVWKSAVKAVPTGTNTLAGLEVKAGYISDRTWDIPSGERAKSTRHGEVKGRKVDSPRFMVGVFDDWRDGLETYGDANTVLCPKYEWDKDDSLFGWQSWGGMEFGLNYTSAMSVLDFFEKELLPKGFCNDKGRCLIVLDSGWGALNDDQLRDFVRKCKDLGVVPGIYTTPFSYWGSPEDGKTDRIWEGAPLSEMLLKTNGEYRKITGCSLDPTHPAVKEWNRKTFRKFQDLGFEFVKIDFLNNGSQEADSHYLPEITTGMQAYNYGMDYIREFAGDMMLDISIGPIFPAKAHMRRIGCDAWGDLPQSMYTLNCINGSWWLDRIYCFNDPDHMVLSKIPFTGKGSNDEQEARIRYTSGLMAGVGLLGGTYAYEGETKRFGKNNVEVIGYDEERARAVEFASNRDLIRMGREGKTFRPVEGTFLNKETLYSKDDISVDSEFILDAGESFYYAVFNYDTTGRDLRKRPDYERLGINPSDYAGVKELWTGERTTPGALQVNVPSKDVRVYRFDRSSEPDSLYLMAYFKSPAQHLFYAVSEDGLNWREANGGNPVFCAFDESVWMRDPFLQKVERGGKTTYHLVHTWGWDNPAIFHWESDDLVNWHATGGGRDTESGKVYVMDGRDGRPEAPNAWAPEFTYVPEEDMFYVYWSSRVNDRQVHYVSRTRDWKEFTVAQVMFDPGMTAIDLTVVPCGGRFYGFYKDERNGRKTILRAEASSLDPAVDGLKGVEFVLPEDYPEEVEGPSVFPRIGGKGWIGYFDEFNGDKGLGFAYIDDLTKPWEIIPKTRVTNVPDVKHGSVIIVSRSEAQGVL